MNFSKHLVACIATGLFTVTPCVASSSEPAPAEQNTDVLVIYSAGLDAVVVDAKDTGLENVIRMLDERLVELGRDFESRGFPSEAIHFVYDVLMSPYCLRVGIEDPANPASIRAQMTVRCADMDQANSLAATLDAMLRKAGLPTQDVQGADMRMTPTPMGPMVFGVENSDTAGPILRMGFVRIEPETFSFQTDLPRDVTPAFFASLDARRAGPLLRSFFASKGEEGRQAWTVLEFLGLAGMQTTPRTWALGFSKDRAISTARVESYVQHSRMSGLFVEQPLMSEDFHRLPVDTTMARLVQFNMSGLLPLLDRIQEGTSEKVTGAVRGMTGVDLQTEIFENLGPTMGVYWSKGSGGGGLMSTVAFFESARALELAAALSRMVQSAQKMSQTMLNGRFRARTWEHGPTACTTLTFPGLPVPVEISYAVSGDELVLTLSPSALIGALNQLSTETSLLDHPRLGLPGDSLRGIHEFGYLDTEHFVHQGFGTASLVAAMLGNGVRSPYDPDRDPGVILPPLEDLAANVQPCVGWGRVQGKDMVRVCLFDRSWTVNGTSMAGTPLSQSYIAIAGLGIVSSVAIPNLLSARTAANESAAIATLRSVASGQAQLNSSCAIDADRDGRGEYGFFGELSGARPLRGPTGGDNLSPPVLSSSFGMLIDDGTGTAVIERAGYVYKLFLPAKENNGVTPGVGEPFDVSVRAGFGTDAQAGEKLWCCYAWPMAYGKTGTRAFFINQDGDVLQFTNHNAEYSGRDGGPDFDAVYSAAGDMSSRAAVNGASAQDGNFWTLVN